MLVETAYISNPGEERRLRDPAHQDRLAGAIHAGMRRYFFENPPPGIACRDARRARRGTGTAPRRVAAARRSVDVAGAYAVERLTSCGSGTASTTEARRLGHDPRDSRRRHLRATSLLDWRGSGAPCRSVSSQARSSTRSPRARSSSARRPSSRNCVENALDAGARHIAIEIEHGGIRLSVCATTATASPPRELRSRSRAMRRARSPRSRISSRSASLGFRGEALPSIASVSRAHARLPRPRRSAAGGAIESVEGRAGKPAAGTASAGHDGRGARPVSPRAGAAQVPARGSDRVPAHAAHGQRLALSRFDVAFTLTHNRREQSRCRRPPTGASARRASRGWSARNSCASRYIEHAQAGLALEGWIGLPSQSRAQPDRQYLYVNGRMVRDRLLVSAVRLGYRDVSYGGRHPAWLLYLTLDPRRSTSMRIRRSSKCASATAARVHDFLFRTVERALAESGQGGDGAAPVAAAGAGRSGTPHANAGAAARRAAPAIEALARMPARDIAGRRRTRSSRSDMRSRSCTASTSSRSPPRAWCSSTCTRRTSASSTSG